MKQLFSGTIFSTLLHACASEIEGRKKKKKRY